LVLRLGRSASRPNIESTNEDSVVVELRAGKNGPLGSLPLGAEEQPVLGFASGATKTRFASIDYGENARKADRP
jgi:hypothetical protein